MHIEDCLTIKQAAQELGVTPAAIRNALYQKRLEFVVLFGTRKFIRRSDLAEYKARTQQEGRPASGRPRREIANA